MKPQTLTLTALATLLLAAPTSAQWWNNPVNGMAVVTNETGYDRNPKIVALEDQKFLICWGRQNPARIKYQIVDELGNTLLERYGRFVIEGTWVSAMHYLVPDGQGGAVCVFRDVRDSTDQIYGQRIDADGNRLWGDNGLPLATWTGENVGLKDVKIDSLGNGFLGWSKNATPINEIYVQKFDLISGERLWGEMGVMDCQAPSTCDYQKIVPDGQGGVIDVWEDMRSGSQKLYAQHLDQNGRILWTPNGIPLYYPNTSNPFTGDVSWGIPDGLGGGIWSGTPSGSNNFVYVFRLSSAGRVVWNWQSSGMNDYSAEALIQHPADGMIWLSLGEHTYPAPWDFVLYRFNPQTGRQLFGSSGIHYGGHTITPVHGGVIVMEMIYDLVNDISARRVANDGTLLWETLLLDGNLNGHPIAAVSDGNNGAVCAFSKYGNELYDVNVFAQRALSDGRLGAPHLPDPAGVAPQEPLALSLRTSASGITYQLPQDSPMTLELVDIRGRKIETIYRGDQKAGSHLIPFDDRGLPSGLYLLKLTTFNAQISVKYLVVR